MKTAWLIVTALLCACGETADRSPSSNAERGRELLWQYGCTSCHSIPGVTGAHGNVGPPLKNIRERVYLAGVLPNSVENLVLWIRMPQWIDPRTAMPDLKVTEQQARDMAAFLYAGAPP